VVRALDQNLEIRLSGMEALIARGTVDLADLGMLPSLTYQAGYTKRDPPGSDSDKTAGDPERRTHSTELAWSILDFGISYVRSKQASNDVLAADERRRRIANTIINDVRVAFWIAALGARRLPELRGISKEIEGAMRRSKELVELRLQDPVIALSYQDALLELQRQMKSYDNEIAQARGRLMRLLNVHPSLDLKLATPPPDEAFRALAALDGAVLEDVALVTRAELRELDYSTRNRELDVLNAYVTGLPNFRLRAAQLYDSTDTIADNRWRESGWAFSFNIISILSTLQRAELARQSVQLYDVRRLGLGLAVMEQVSIAREQLIVLDDDFQLSKDMSVVRSRIYEVRRDRLPFDATDELEKIRAAVAAVAAQIREDRAYGALQKAYGDMLASTGMDQFPADIDVASPQAAARIERHLAGLPQAVQERAARVAQLRAEAEKKTK
jgi:outer membrane protein TolC